MLKRNFIYKFWRLFLFLLIFSFAFSSVAPVIAAPEAEPPTNQQKAPPLSDYALEGFAPNKDDVNLSYLNALTGDIGGFHFFSENENPSVTKMFQIFNTGIVAVAAIVFMWNLLSAAVNSAHDGEFLGKRYNSFWTPTRAAFGIIFIMPVMAGWSPAQTAMAWAAWGGTGIANKIVANSDIGEAVARSTSGMAGSIAENGQAEAEKIKTNVLCLFDVDTDRLIKLAASGGEAAGIADEVLKKNTWTIDAKQYSNGFIITFGNTEGTGTECGVIEKQLPMLNNFANSQFPAIKEWRDKFMEQYVKLYSTMALKIQTSVQTQAQILSQKEKPAKKEDVQLFVDEIHKAAALAGYEFKTDLETLNDVLRTLQGDAIYKQIINSANNYSGGGSGASWVGYGFHAIPGLIASLTSTKAIQVVDKSIPPTIKINSNATVSDIPMSTKAKQEIILAAQSAAQGVTSFASGLYSTITNPVETAKNTWIWFSDKASSAVDSTFNSGVNTAKNLLNNAAALSEIYQSNGVTGLLKAGYNEVTNKDNYSSINNFADDLAKTLGISNLPMDLSNRLQKLSVEYGSTPLAALQSLGILILQLVGKTLYVLIIALPFAIIGATGLTSFGTGTISFLIGGVSSTIANWVAKLGNMAEAVLGKLSMFYFAIFIMLLTIIIPLTVFGIKMMIIVPFTPTLMWIAGIATYFVVFIESLFGAQLWAMAHLLTSDGEGMGERTRHGYLFILNLFFRPAIMVITLYFAYQLVNLLGGIGTNVITTAMSASVNGIGEVGFFDTNFWMAMFIILGLFMIWLALMENLIHMCFSLLFIVPNQVFTWVGGQFGSQLGQDIGKSVSGQAGGGLHQVVNQFGMHNLKQYGEQFNKGLKAFNWQNDTIEAIERGYYYKKNNSSQGQGNNGNQNFFNKMTEYKDKK